MVSYSLLDKFAEDWIWEGGLCPLCMFMMIILRLKY